MKIPLMKIPLWKLPKDERSKIEREIQLLKANRDYYQHYVDSTESQLLALKASLVSVQNKLADITNRYSF